MLDPVVKKYLFYKSPLRTQKGKLYLYGILAIVLTLAVIGWIHVQEGRPVLNVFAWAPYAMLGSIPAYFLIAFLDRERRVRPFHFLVIASVFLVTAPVAAYLNGLIDPIKFYTVGFYEEAMKILPVLLLAIYVPNLIRSKKDGIVYGALAGMGFNIIEIGEYIATEIFLGQTVTGAAFAHSARLSLFGLGSHLIWSAFVGLGIGYAMESKLKGFRKWRRAIVYYLLAAVAHSVFDLGGSAIGLLPIMFVSAAFRGVSIDSVSEEVKTGHALGPMRDAMKYGTYIYNVIFLIVIFIQTKRSFAWENHLQMEQLSSEAKDVISEKELKLLSKEKFFTKRKYKNYSKGTSSDIIHYQNLLAMQKEVMAREGSSSEGENIVNLLRTQIKTLRAY